MNSRQKGKRGELEARNAVREHLPYPECIRAAQVSGAFSADLLNTGRLHVEVKRRKAIAALHFLRQAIGDAKPDEIPFVVMREDKDTDWVVMFRLSDVGAFVEEINSKAKA